MGSGGGGGRFQRNRTMLHSTERCPVKRHTALMLSPVKFQFLTALQHEDDVASARLQQEAEAQRVARQRDDGHGLLYGGDAQDRDALVTVAPLPPAVQACGPRHDNNKGTHRTVLAPHNAGRRRGSPLAGSGTRVPSLSLREAQREHQPRGTLTHRARMRKIARVARQTGQYGLSMKLLKQSGSPSAQPRTSRRRQAAADAEARRAVALGPQKISSVTSPASRGTMMLTTQQLHLFL